MKRNHGLFFSLRICGSHTRQRPRQWRAFRRRLDRSLRQSRKTRRGQVAPVPAQSPRSRNCITDKAHDPCQEGRREAPGWWSSGFALLRSRPTTALRLRHSPTLVQYFFSIAAAAGYSFFAFAKKIPSAIISGVQPSLVLAFTSAPRSIRNCTIEGCPETTAA